MQQDRRSEDKRMEKIEKDILEISAIVHKIETKIYDGYDTSIKNTAINVKRIDSENQKQHDKLEKKMDNLSDQMNKMLWKLSGIGFFGIISFFVAHTLKWL